MQESLILCVPNFSEGRDQSVIREIILAIESVRGVELLGVESGKSANRTVVSFAASPVDVIEAAFGAVKTASELIDMRKHKGAHPRFGATDVCPLVPFANIGMDETVGYAHRLASKIGAEIGLPVFCYGDAALYEIRKNLANCRAGEYEKLPEKLADPFWKPDYGESRFNPFSGAVAVGARDFLIAYNVNLSTNSESVARKIAADIRKIREHKTNQNLTGKNISQYGNSHQATPNRVSNGVTSAPDALRGVKAIGWYLEEYGIAQVSINITDINLSPMHDVYNEVARLAGLLGVCVTGSEIVGLVPLKVLLEAGRFFSIKQNLPTAVPESALIDIAVEKLGLNNLSLFEPEKKILEYVYRLKKVC